MSDEAMALVLIMWSRSWKRKARAMHSKGDGRACAMMGLSYRAADLAEAHGWAR